MDLNAVLDAHAKPPETLRALFKLLRKGAVNAISIVDPQSPNEDDVTWLADAQTSTLSEGVADNPPYAQQRDAPKPFEVRGLPGRPIEH
jgi:hypothetical protein